MNVISIKLKLKKMFIIRAKLHKTVTGIQSIRNSKT